MHAPLQQTYRVERRPLTALHGIADEWCALAASAVEPNVFYEPSFALAAAPVFGAGVEALVVRSTHGRLVGLMPLLLDRLRGAWVGWTHPFAPLGVPLIDRADPDAVLAAMLEHLADDRPARLLLPYLPEAGAVSRALDGLLSHRQQLTRWFGLHQRALLDPGAQRDGYLDRALTGSRRKELRRQLRRLEKTAPVTFSVAQGDDATRALPHFLALEASGWKGAAGSAIVSDPAVRTFVQSAMAGLAAESKLRIDRLHVGDATVAATLTLTSGDTAWCWKIAYDEALARSSPGVQLICALTDSVLATPLPRRVDSCAAPDHPMINHIWRERLAIGDRMIALKSSLMPFTVACGIEGARRQSIAHAKALRARLRR